MLNIDTWNHLTVGKQIISRTSFKNIFKQLQIILC